MLEEMRENVYVTVVNKRIRNLKKKVANMDKAEALLASGGVLNAEQLALISNRPNTERMLAELEGIKASLLEVAAGEAATVAATPPSPPTPAADTAAAATTDRLLEVMHVVARYPTLSINPNAKLPSAVVYLSKCLSGEMYVVDYEAGLSRASEIAARYLLCQVQDDKSGKGDNTPLIAGTSYGDVARLVAGLAAEMASPTAEKADKETTKKGGDEGGDKGKGKGNKKSSDTTARAEEREEREEQEQQDATVSSEAPPPSTSASATASSDDAAPLPKKERKARKPRASKPDRDPISAMRDPDAAASASVDGAAALMAAMSVSMQPTGDTSAPPAAPKRGRGGEKYALKATEAAATSTTTATTAADSEGSKPKRTRERRARGPKSAVAEGSDESTAPAPAGAGALKPITGAKPAPKTDASKTNPAAAASVALGCGVKAKATRSRGPRKPRAAKPAAV